MNKMIMMYGKVERTWKEAVVFYLYTQFLYLLGGTEKAIISALPGFTVDTSLRHMTGITA
jgi:hypothetical protein